jgi:hypothetical protein
LHRRQSDAAKRLRRARAGAFIDDYLASHPCTDCGEHDPVVLEFDHLDRKDASLSQLKADGWSTKRLEREIALCEVVCVNCHRRRTARRGKSWRLDPGTIENDPTLLPAEKRNMMLIREVFADGRCVDCGLADFLVLEFDHIGEKRGNVIALAKRGCGVKTLDLEISRCQIRCANCHRRRTRLAWDRSQAA